MDKELQITATGETTSEVVNGTAGSPDNIVTEEKVEEVPWRLSVGGGCQDLLNKAFQTILNEGDAVLVETVSEILSSYKTRACRLIKRG